MCVRVLQIILDFTNILNTCVTTFGLFWCLSWIIGTITIVNSLNTSYSTTSAGIWNLNGDHRLYRRMCTVTHRRIWKICVQKKKKQPLNNNGTIFTGYPLAITLNRLPT